MSLLSDRELKALWQRARSVFGDVPIIDAVPRRKAIVFVRPAVSAAVVAAVDEKLAQAAFDSLANERIPSPLELEALQACIRFMRPALFVTEGQIEPPPTGLSPFSDLQQKAVERLLPGVAAVGFADEPMGIATGFLIGPRALLTHPHVVVALEKRLGTPLPSGQVIARFGLERGTVESFPPVPVRGVLFQSSNPLDAAVLELAHDCSLRRCLPLARVTPADPGRKVVTVGYPLKDSCQPLYTDAVFENLYGVKRASPGETLPSTPGILYHDCSTLGGNSGSPVIDGESAWVVGLHRTGTFALRNEAVATDALFADTVLRQHVIQWT